MATADHRALIAAHFQAMAAREVETLRSQLTPSVRWWAPQSTEARGLARPVSGRDAVLALLTSEGFYRPEGRTWSLHHVIVAEDTVAVHATLEARTATGQTYRNQYVFVYEFRDDLIDQVWEHLDTAYAYPLLDSTPSPGPVDARIKEATGG